METSFDFNILHNEYIYGVNSSYNLRVRRVSDSIAVLYFTDKLGKKLNIPDGIVVYTYDYKTNKKIIQNNIHQDYLLCWTDDYIVELNNIVLVNIKNQRRWNIVS